MTRSEQVAELRSIAQWLRDLEKRDHGERSKGSSEAESLDAIAAMLEAPDALEALDAALREFAIYEIRASGLPQYSSWTLDAFRYSMEVQSGEGATFSAALLAALEEARKAST